MALRWVFALAVAVLGLQGSAQGQARESGGSKTYFHVFDEDGQWHGSGELRPTPYMTGESAPMLTGFLKHRNVVDSKGVVVSGLGFYGWKDKDVAKVLVWALVPRAGVPNRFLFQAGDTPSRLAQLRELTTLEFRLGETRAIDAMKGWGLKPYTIKVDTRRSYGE